MTPISEDIVGALVVYFFN